MQNIQLKLHNNKEIAETYDLKKGEVLTIKNIRGVNYELFNIIEGNAPQNIITKRIGQDLHIILDENDRDKKGDPLDINPDVIIEDYYGMIDEEREALHKTENHPDSDHNDATGILIGMHENGKYYAYVPESGETGDAISILPDETARPQAIGGDALECGAFFFPWWALLGLLPLAFLAKDSDPEPEPEPKGELELIKTSTEPTTVKAGDKIEYVFTVKNTGDVVVKNISISDPKLGITKLALDKTELAPGETGTAKASYTVTQVDIDTGVVVNTATATGKDPSGKDVSDVSDNGTPTDDDSDGNPDNDPTITNLPDAHKIELLKTSSIASNAGVGVKITYEFTVKNTGNVTVKDIKITDTKLGEDKIIEVGNLAPGDSKKVSAQYTITQADVDSGKIANSATAKGFDPRGHEVTDISDSTNPADDDGKPTADKTIKDKDGNPLGDDGKDDNDPTVTIIQRPPHATDDLVENIEIGQSVTIDVVGTDNGGNGVDSDPENNIDPTTVKLVDADPNSNGKIKTVPNEGTWKVNPDGTVTFTPLPTFKADPKPVKYTVKDTTGLESNEATITADYQPYETAPVSEEDFGTEPEDTPIKGNVLENDKDDDGDVLKVKDFSLDTDGDGVVDTTYQPGEVVDVYKNGAS